MVETQVTQVRHGVPEVVGLSPAAPAPTRPTSVYGLSRRTLVQGFAGSVAMVVGALGAGGVLIHDPILDNSPLSWVRYGHGRYLAQAVVYLGVALLVWAWVRLGRDVIANRVRGRGVLIAATAWIAPMVVSPPQFTRDVFSYLAQGELSLHGLDPYTIGPSVLGDTVALNVHPFWQDTPAPYGPLFILLAKWIAAAVGENLIAGVILMRLVMMVGLVLLVWALPGLVRHLGGRLSVALWLVVASPMMIIHLTGGPHNDLLMIGLLALGTLLVLDRRHATGIALVTLGMAVKATAGVALPFLVWVWAGRLTGTWQRRLVRAGASGLAVFAVVFGVTMFVARVNFGWIGALQAPTMIVNWVNLPTGLGELLHGIVGWFGGLSEEPFVAMTRFVGIVTLVAIVVRQWWLSRDGGPEAVRRMGVALLAVAILAPPTLPWYLTWGMTILAATRWKREWLAGYAGLVVLVLLVYYPNGEGAMGDLPHMVWVILAAVLTGVSVLRADPLRLRARYRPAPAAPAVPAVPDDPDPPEPDAVAAGRGPAAGD